jgi:hypothetical protein
MRSVTSHQTLGRIFAIPVVLNVMAAVGLAAGLFGEGGFDIASWLLLALPLAVAGWCAQSRTGRRRIVP